MADSNNRHTFDGIEEEDNQLPRWWMATFVVTVLFGFGYWVYFHTLAAEPGPHEQLKAEMKALQVMMKKPEGPGLDDAALFALSHDQSAMGQAEELWLQYCSGCHGEFGEGGIAPNLTDGYWKHGRGGPADIRKIVAEGVPAKGMKAWEPKIGKERVDLLAAKVLTMAGKVFPGAREPEGELVR